MGNGQVRGFQSSAVVTVVLAGGRTEKFKKPVFAEDIMLRHPRHHVVRVDFFSASPVVVLEPEEVLMPGHKFFLVPFHTVHQTLSRKVSEVGLHSSYSTTSFPAAGGAQSGSPDPYHDPGSIRDLKWPFRHGPDPAQSSKRILKKDLAGPGEGTAKRSPPGRPSGSRKISPRTLLHARETLLHKETSRNSRRRHSGDSRDYASLKEMSLQSRTTRDSSNVGSPLPEFTENNISQFSDIPDLLSFGYPDIAEGSYSRIESPVTQQAEPPLGLPRPQYEAFETSLSFSMKSWIEPTKHDSFEAAVPQAVETKDDDSVEPTDIPKYRRSSYEPLPPKTGIFVRQLVHSFEAMASSSEKESRLSMSASKNSFGRTSPKGSSRELISRYLKNSIEQESPKKSSRGLISLESKPLQQKSTAINSREPIAPNSTPISPASTEHFEAVDSPATYAAFFRMKEKINCRSDREMPDRLGHQKGKGPVLSSSYNEPPRPSSTEILQSKQMKVPTMMVDYAADPQLSRDYRRRQNGSRQHVISEGPERRPKEREEIEGPAQQRKMADRMRDPKADWHLARPKGAGNSRLEVKPLDSGSLSKSSSQRLKSGTSTAARMGRRPPPASQAASSKPSTSIRSVKMSPMLTQKWEPYRRSLIERLCFSSSRYFQSPLILHAATGNQEKHIKNKLKLKDHLKVEPSPPPRQVHMFFNQSRLNAHAIKISQSPSRRKQLPMTTGGGGSRRDFAKAQKYVAPASHLNQAEVNNQLDLTTNIVRSSRISVNHDKGKTSIEDKFLKLPSPGYFRHRKVRTRSRIHTSANWKPKLSPLVEFSP